jgi:hypothetical protein
VAAQTGFIVSAWRRSAVEQTQIQTRTRKAHPMTHRPTRPSTPRPARLSGLTTPLVLIALVALTACASTPPPLEELAVGRAAVERATGSVAADAPLEMAAASDKINRANLAFDRKEYGLARRLANEAEADAALAQAQARAARSGRALDEVRDGARMLREETQRK